MSTSKKLTLTQVKESFPLFLYLVWKHLNLPRPSDVQLDLADYLQNGGKRIIIQALRGEGKSWITSAYVVWLLLRDPQLEILVVSANNARASAFTRFTLTLVKTMPMLRHLIPNPDQKQSTDAFDVRPKKASHSNSIMSIGVNGQMEGKRADIIVADDVEILKNSLTVDLREKLLHRVTEFEAVLKPHSEYQQVVFLGTPQTAETIYTKLEDRGYIPRIWPARIPEDPLLYRGNLAPSIQARIDRGELAGSAVDPAMKDNEYLREAEMSMGRSAFQLQYMLNTSLSDAEKFPLKTSDAIVTSIDPNIAPVKVAHGRIKDTLAKDLPQIGFSGDKWYKPLYIDDKWTNYKSKVMSIDPSGRGKDEMGYAIGMMLNGMIFCPECTGLKGGYSEENLITLAKEAKKYSVNEIIIESNFGDGMFEKIFQPILQKIYPCKITEVRHSIQKERRIIDTLEPVMNQHRLLFDHSLVERDINDAMKSSEENSLVYSLFYQMTRITLERGSLKHDDRLDALSIMVAYFVNAMAQDADVMADRYERERADKEAERFLNCATSKKLHLSYSSDPNVKVGKTSSMTSVTASSSSLKNPRSIQRSVRSSMRHQNRPNLMRRR